MTIYELAKRVNPDIMKDHQGKLIWKGARGEFAYLFKEDDVIYLRVSYSIAQLRFYWLDSFAEWVTAQLFEYQEIVELWKTEQINQ
jgi:hypothetical protein